MCELTKEAIQELLLRKDEKQMDVIGRALLVLHKNQTYYEKAAKTTQYHNGVGFRPAHARMGSSMAEFYARKGYLSPRQVSYWIDPPNTNAGQIRITLYWKQLIEAAKARQVKKELAA